MIIEKQIIDTEQMEDQNLENEEIISFKEKETETIIEPKIDLNEKEIELDLQKKKNSRKRPIEENQIESRKQPMRKVKEGRDFTIYAKNIELENEIENYLIDTSFKFFVSEIIEKKI